MGSADRVLADYAVMLLVLLNFACARQAGLDVLLRLARPIRFLAGHTFTLYLSHGIVIGLWTSVLPIERGAAYDIVAIGTAIAITALALNPLTDALQHTLRRALEAGIVLGSRGIRLKA
jgi:peptidoglycan/LPS O-acetylase OafA/YrhL